MQAARIGVIALPEFPARVQFCKDDLNARHLLFGVNIRRNAAAVVLDRRTAVFMQSYFDLIGVTVGRLVDRVIDDFP